MNNLQPSIDAFMMNLPVGARAFTVRQYRSVLMRFGKFDAAHDEPIAESVIHFIRTFKDHAPATRQNYISIVRQFIDWLATNELVTLSPKELDALNKTLKKMTPKFSHLPDVPNEQDIDAIIQAAVDARPAPTGNLSKDRVANLIYLRDIAILRALRSSGLRIGELLSLRRGDLDESIKGIKKVTGKGDKQRTAYFGDKTWFAIKAYLDAREDGAQNKSLASQPVFMRHDRGAGTKSGTLSTQSAEGIMEHYAKHAGVQNIPTPHRFRAAFATRMLSETGNLAITQDALGHASPATTRRYAKVNQEELHTAHRAVMKDE